SLCGHPRKQAFVRPQGDYALCVRMIPGKGSSKSQFRFPPAEVTFLFAGILESKLSYARKEKSQLRLKRNWLLRRKRDSNPRYP
ncbi:MAG: hypothetical protein PHP77_10695, partial [Bacteroidales bacterium]|nr:hypothetical protein [Bacteroidales bacterium]